MQRLVSAGRVALLFGLSVSLVGCTQWNQLKGKKLFRDANLLYQQQDYRRAAEVYGEAVASDPNLTAAYFYLANSYDNLYRPGRAGEAENDALLQRAIENYKLAAEREADPKMKKLALEYLVSAYGPDKLNQPDMAEPLIQQMVQLDPTDPANYWALAKLYEDSGQYDVAEEMLVKAREAKPNDSAVYMQLAGFYNRQGEFGKTIEALKARAEREPNNPEAFYTMATFYWDKAYRDLALKDAEKGQFAQAGMEAVDKALQLNPDYMEAVTYRGLLLRVQALVDKNPANQKRLLDEAEKMQQRAAELKKKRGAVESE